MHDRLIPATTAADKAELRVCRAAPPGRRLSLLVTIALLLPVGAVAVADDLTSLSLEDLLDVKVVSVSKFSQRISEAPSSVSNISADDIRSYGYRTLGDVLKSVRGFTVSSDRLYSYGGVRGFSPAGDYNDRLLVMVDGYRINDVIYDQAFLGSEFPLDLDLVDHIEVVRGPGSSVYGSNALFGVINVVTKKGADLAGTELSGELGSHRFAKGRVSVGRRLEGGGDLLLSVSGEGGRGEDLTFPEFGTGGRAGSDFLRNKRFFGRYSQDGFAVFGGLSRRDKGNPSALNSGVFDQPGNQVVDEQGFVDAHYTAKLRGGSEVTGRVFAGLSDFTGSYLQPDPLRMNMDLARARWWGLELKGLTTLADSHKLVFGLESQTATRQDFNNYDIAPKTVYLQEQHASKRLGVYVQDEWQALEALILTLGLRFDRISEQQNQASPRLAANWRLSERTVAKFLYGSAFRAPNTYEMFYSYPEQQIGNAALQSERLQTYESTLEHYLQPSLRLSASAYYYAMRQQISQILNPSGLLQFENMGDVRGRGLEFEGEKLWSDGARLRASLGLQHPTDANGQLPANTPRTLTKLNYTQPLDAGRWKLGAEVQHSSARSTGTGSVAGNVIANLTLSRPMAHNGWEFSASVFNLFNRAYADPVSDDNLGLNRSSMPAEGRSLRVKFTTHLRSPG